jgi:hypothetical protein
VPAFPVKKTFLPARTASSTPATTGKVMGRQRNGGMGEGSGERGVRHCSCVSASFMRDTDLLGIAVRAGLLPPESGSAQLQRQDGSRGLGRATGAWMGMG